MGPKMATIQGSNQGGSRHPRPRPLLLPLLLCMMTAVFTMLAAAGGVSSEMVFRVDPLALLSGTLRTYQKAGCDTDSISLSCPRGTSISIEVAQYSNTVGDATVAASMCPQATAALTEAASVGLGSTAIAVSTETEAKAIENCLPHALQYSLLQNVVETCQKKSHCKFLLSPGRHTENDPCPEKQKFVEVAYKCRPYEFRSKVACENDVIQLECNPFSRIAVYSASFGRTEYESIQCSQPQGVMEETCLVSYATETVMDMCHGKRRCSIPADIATFGNPCRPDSRVYLKVVYTCIPRKVLKDRFDYAREPDEPVDPELNKDDLYDEDQFYRESEAVPPAPKLHRELSNPKELADPFVPEEPSSSANPPLRSREGNHLEVTTDDGNIDSNFPHPTSDDNDIDIDGNDGFDDATVDVLASQSGDDDAGSKQTAGAPQRPQPPPTDCHSSPSPAAGDSQNIAQSSIFIPADGGADASEYPPFDENVNSTATRTTASTTQQRRRSDCKEKPIGFVVEWMNAYIFVAKNQEKFYLYLIISVTAGVLLCLMLVIGRLLVQRRRLKKEPPPSASQSAASQMPPSQSGETTLPNGFADDISEIDNDIDLTTPLPLASVSRSDQTYGSYAPSPSPYGNLGPTNISHTSTTMLVPTANPSAGGGSLAGIGGIGGGIGGHHQHHQQHHQQHQHQQQQQQHHPPHMQMGPPPTILGAPNSLLYPTTNHHHMQNAGLLGHPNYAPHPVYIGGSLVGGGGGGGVGGGLGGHPHQHPGTLGRRPREYEHTPPRILSKIDGSDQQPYYYG